MTTDLLLIEIKAEMDRGTELYGDFASPHEGYAVIKEELDELWLLIRYHEGDSDEAKREAIQIAAMALKYILCCVQKDHSSEFVIGKDAL